MLEPLRQRFSFPFVGCVPPVKPAGALPRLNSVGALPRRGAIGLLATPATVGRAYTDALVRDFAGDSPVIRIGALRYLNAWPLVDGLVDDVTVEVVHAPPSELARRLRDHELDLGLVPAVELVRQPDYRVVPDLCVSADGAVESILLFHRRPWDALHRIGVDTSSNSSVELLRVLLWKHGRTDVDLPSGPDFFRFSDADEYCRSLSAVGFASPVVQEVPQVWRFAAADDLFDTMKESTVRTAGLLRAQTDAAQLAIRAAVRASVLGYAVGSGFELPMPAVLGSAIRP